MLNDEITSIKEELLKEIRSVENKLNLQILVKNQEITEKNKKFMNEFQSIYEKNKVLYNTLTTYSINLEKINDFENFRKKMESMTITHEIRINNSINDIKNIQFKMGKEIENLTIPGFIGPTSKYKTIASYISSNINEVEKIKNDNETIKKDNKETKKKVEDLLKTVINLVDGTSSKCIEYTDKHIKKLDEFVKKKMEEFSDKILNFKTLLLTQEKVDKMNENFFRVLESNYFNKKEVDFMINNAINNFGINIDNLKVDIDKQINNMIKINNENLENEIKDNIKSIKDINMKINKINQVQNQILKHNLSSKNLLFSNNNEQSFNSYKSDIKINANSSFSNIKHNTKEEEKYSKFRKVDSLDKYKTIDSIDDIKNKNNNNYRSSEPNQFRERNNPINIDNYQNKKIDIIKKDLFNNNISKFDKTKQETNCNNINSEENKNSFSDYKNKLDSSNNKSDLSNNKIDIMKTDINNSPYKFKSSVLDLKNGKIESKNKNRISFLKKNFADKNKIISKQSNISNMLSFGINNQKNTITSFDITNNKEDKEDKNKIIKIFEDNFDKNKNINENINETINENINDNITTKKRGRRGYSLHKLASIGFEEKINEVLPKVRALSNKNMKFTNRKPHTPVVKKVFDENYQFSVNNKIKDNLTIDAPVKVISSFGRTGYTFYNKKEDGINNLINKGINNKIKKYINNSLDFNIELSPVTKIQVYGNV